MSMQLPMIWPSVETEHENAKEKETEIEGDGERDRGRQSSKFIGQGDFSVNCTARLAALRFVDCVFNYNKVTD